MISYFMGKKELVTLVMGDSSISYEVEKPPPIKKEKKKRFEKKKLNVDAISINASKMAIKFCLTEDTSYVGIVQNPRLYRKEQTYISR